MVGLSAGSQPTSESAERTPGRVTQAAGGEQGVFTFSLISAAELRLGRQMSVYITVCPKARRAPKTLLCLLFCNFTLHFFCFSTCVWVGGGGHATTHVWLSHTKKYILYIYYTVN